MSKTKLTVIIVVILAIVIGFGVYWVMGKQEFEAAWAAHQSCDCVAAVEGYKKVTSTYSLTFASYVNEARKNLAECEIVLMGDLYRDKKLWEDAIYKYTAYLSQFPDGVMIPYVEKELTNLYETAKQFVSEKRYCDASPIFDAFIACAYFTNEAKAAMPEVLYYCGLEMYNRGIYKKALTIIRQLIEDYPDCLFVSDAEALRVDVRVADLIRGDTGELRHPRKTGSTTPGTAIVVICNDAPELLEVLFSGPDSKSVLIEECTGCPVYSGIGPFFCPEKGPKVNINLAPGVYNVVAIFPDIVSSGEWTLEDGAEYFICFIITKLFG